MFLKCLFTNVVLAQNKPGVFIKVKPEPDPKNRAGARFATLNDQREFFKKEISRIH